MYFSKSVPPLPVHWMEIGNGDLFSGVVLMHTMANLAFVICACFLIQSLEVVIFSHCSVEREFAFDDSKSSLQPTKKSASKGDFGASKYALFGR